MLAVGELAPDFTLPDDTGQPVSLRELLSRGRVVLFFYPKDATPICTRQACMVRESTDDAARAGLIVVGVSPQGQASKAAFRAAQGLRHVMLTDAGERVAKQYGATGLFGLPIPLGTRRVTYLITQDGRIADAVHAELSVAKHEALLRRAIASSS